MKGKLSIDDLQDVVMKHLTFKHPEVLTRAGIGKDCAAVDFGEDVLIITSDPITGTEKGLGGLAVNINLNDLATTGCKLTGLMLTILAPPDTAKAQISDIIKDAVTTAKAHGVEIIGGHTEWTDAVNQIVASVTAIGKQEKRLFLNQPKLKVGDKIAVTKSVGIEGTGILAFEHQAVLNMYLTEDELIAAKSMLDKTSVVKEGIIAKPFCPSAMHDVTEGGLLGAIWELCYGEHVGCQIDRQKIPIATVSQKIADLFNIDILRLISSGTMLIIADEKAMEGMSLALQNEGIKLTVIGEITGDNKRVIIDSDNKIEIAPPEGDALYEAEINIINQERQMNDI